MNEGRSIRPSLFDITRYFALLGATGFGGPVALANKMRVDLVEQRTWLSESEYDEGLALATACPGPLAYQLGVYCGYVLRGIRGACAVAVAFATAPFALVCLVAYLYVHFSGSWETRALFYGIGPVVVALIVKACWNLGKRTLGRDVTAWVFFLVALSVTLIVEQELTMLFLIAGATGAFIFAGKRVAIPHAPLRSLNPFALVAIVLVGSVATTGAVALFLFFLKTGFLVFGSGLVIVPFLKAYVVNQYHWLNNQQFLDAVAVGMISPGPVVITATFVGYLLDGLVGAAAATLGIFLPPFLFVLVGTPLLRRYRANVRFQGFLRGVTLAVVGVLTGTTYLVAKIAISDLLGVAMAAIALFFVFRTRIADPVLVLAAGVLGLIAYPLLHVGITAQ